jgi:hypothetical protein
LRFMDCWQAVRYDDGKLLAVENGRYCTTLCAYGLLSLVPYDLVSKWNDARQSCPCDVRSSFHSYSPLVPLHRTLDARLDMQDSRRISFPSVISTSFCQKRRQDDESAYVTPRVAIPRERRLNSFGRVALAAFWHFSIRSSFPLFSAFPHKRGKPSSPCRCAFSHLNAAALLAWRPSHQLSTVFLNFPLG